MSTIELLAPAKDLDTGRAAIDCGADAVYVGAPRFGAREAAGNSIDAVTELCAYAHRYWVRVYATVNTLLRDEELEDAVRMCHDLHRAGVDGLIIQDVGLLECDLPPLPIIASTQMHNATPERVAFLEKVGFSRAILARELDLTQIAAIRAATALDLEVFVHGALCVCYSGRCYLSYGLGGRSGNRGQCAQPCRRGYSLEDGSGRRLSNEGHLLSLRDLNLTDDLRALLEAGVTSFKIEGRLKNRAYVMNVVGHYRRELDALLPTLGHRRASSGQTTLGFAPDPDKTFNRGYTTYFLHGRGAEVASPDSPKHVGEPLGQVTSVRRDSVTLQTDASLHSGDGIAFFAGDRELQGTVVNRVDGATIFPEKLAGLARGVRVFRNHDHAFVSQVNHSQNQRRIPVVLRLTEAPNGFRLEATDDDGVTGGLSLDCDKVWADKPAQARTALERQLAKLGSSEFSCVRVDMDLPRMPHLPLAVINGLRRDAIAELQKVRLQHRPVLQRQTARAEVRFPQTDLTFEANVLNQKAAAFYRRHGVERVEFGAESGIELGGRKVMTTRYCLKFEHGLCPRRPESKGKAVPPDPWFLIDDENRRFRLRFRCDQKDCVMELYLS
jgi:putative protease